MTRFRKTLSENRCWNTFKRNALSESLRTKET